MASDPLHKLWNMAKQLEGEIAAKFKYELLRIEAEMGIYATAINSLEAEVTSLQATNTSQASTITGLQSQLTAATALEPDSSDVSAAQGVSEFLAALTPAAPAAPPAGT